MGKGSNTSTTSSTSAPDPQAAAAYRDLITRAQGVAGTPYQAYTGNLSAGQNAQQNTGVASINSANGWATPYLQDASSQSAQWSAPITDQDIAKYQNPYTQQVVDATTAQMRHDNASQNAALTGNQISQGALGGNATGVARGILAGQQGRTMASTVAGLYDNSYKQALAAAQNQQRTGQAGAQAQAQFGLSGQNAQLQTGMAQFGVGQTQQTAEQAALDRQYAQYQQAQAYPYQQAQWLAGMATGVGSNLGGTSNGTTTGPAPNQTGQWLGAGLSAASLFMSDARAKEDIEEIGSLNDGQKIYRYRYKGQPGVHIGLIAQEAEQHNPDSVHRGVGGMRFVDMDEATEGAVRRADGGGVFGDYDPPGVSGGQQFAQSSPWQMRPNGNGTVSVLNVRTGQIIYTGTPSGAASAQASAPRQRAAGGGVGVVPWGGGDSWIPQMNIHGGQGAPQARAPSLPEQKSSFDPEKISKGIMGVGKGLQGMDWGGAYSAGLGNLSGESWGGGSFWDGSSYGGSSASPLAGLDASDYGAGFAAGGGVGGFPGDRFDAAYGGFDPEEARYREGDGFKSMMDTPDPFGETNRIVAHDALQRGDGVRSYGDDTPVFGPDGKMMGNQTSLQGVATAPAGAPVVAEEEDEAPAPAGVAGRASGAGRPPVMASDRDAAYYDRPDAAEPRGSGIGLGLISPNAQTGLLTAGLGMLASRSPFLGNVVGEGGLAGVGAYGRAEEKDREVAAEAAKLSREARKDANKFGLDVRRQDETERHNKESEKNTRATADRTKFVPAGQYMGADGVYRPVAMDQSTGRLVDMANGKDIAAGSKVLGKGEKPDGFSDEDAAKVAERYVKSGDRTVLQGFGTSGAAKIKIQRQVDKVMEREGITPEAMAQRTVEFEGRKAGSRTLGTMEAKMGAAAFEAEGAIKLIRGVIEKLPRTAFLPFNQLLQGYSKKTLNPDQAELYARAQAIVNTYSAVMSRGANVTTDSSRHHASELLNTAYDAKTFNRVLDTMQNEIDMAKASPAKMQEYYAKHYGPKSVENGTGSAGSPPSSGGFKPPAGAIPRVYQGKTYYYDPTTKQPYPGQ